MYPYPVAKFSCRQRGLDERYKHLNTTLNIQFVKFPRGFRKRAPIYLGRGAPGPFYQAQELLNLFGGELRFGVTIVQNAGAIPGQPIGNHVILKS